MTIWLHGLYSTRLLCPWNSLGKNAAVACHFYSRGSSWLRDWTARLRFLLFILFKNSVLLCHQSHLCKPTRMILLPFSQPFPDLSLFRIKFQVFHIAYRAICHLFPAHTPTKSLARGHNRYSEFRKQHMYALLCQSLLMAYDSITSFLSCFTVKELQ